MVAFPEHGLPAAVAGEHQRPGRALTADGRRAHPQLPAQILVGGPGIPGVQPYDLSGRYDRPDADGARLRVRARHAAHQEVALLVLRLATVDHDADQQPGGDEGTLVQGQLGDRLLDGLDRRTPRELVDDVALGGRDRHLTAQRRRPL